MSLGKALLVLNVTALITNLYFTDYPMSLVSCLGIMCSLVCVMIENRLKKGE